MNQTIFNALITLFDNKQKAWVGGLLGFVIGLVLELPSVDFTNITVSDIVSVVVTATVCGISVATGVYLFPNRSKKETPPDEPK